MKMCTTCGTPNDNAQSVCQVCGTPLFASAAPEDQTQADDTATEAAQPVPAQEPVPTVAPEALTRVEEPAPSVDEDDALQAAMAAAASALDEPDPPNQAHNPPSADVLSVDLPEVEVMPVTAPAPEPAPTPTPTPAPIEPEDIQAPEPPPENIVAALLDETLAEDSAIEALPGAEDPVSIEIAKPKVSTGQIPTTTPPAPAPPPKQGMSMGTFVMVVVALIVLLGGGAAIYFFVLN